MSLPPPVPRPPVIAWFHAYSVVFVLMYLAVAAVGLVLLFIDPATINTYLAEPGADTHAGTTSGSWTGVDSAVMKVIGAVFVILGLFFTVVSAIPLLVSPRPWLWTFSLVLICLGLTSPCFLPFSIPLMIFWLKPETKAYYGKQ